MWIGYWSGLQATLFGTGSGEAVVYGYNDAARVQQ